MKKTLVGTVFALLLLHAAGMAAWAQETIDFEGLAEGAIPDTVTGSGGSVVGLFGLNPFFGPGTNAAMIFDSSCPGGCSGGDPDLGTPNETFGGPGIGLGGQAGPYQNDTPLGNLLIISENLNQGNPDDADVIGAAFRFDFSGVGSGSATISSITIIDVEANEPAATVELFSGVTLLAVFTLPQTGDNGVEPDFGLGPTPGVDMMYVTLNGSGAIDNLVFTPDNGTGDEGCSPGYWRNHLEDWPPTGFSPGDDFDTTFLVDLFDPDITLGRAIRLGGGGVRKLARHGTAALLSAAHPDVGYPLTVDQVIAAVQAGDAQTLAAFNELGCLID